MPILASPSGRLVNVNEKRLEKRLREGFRVPTEEELRRLVKSNNPQKKDNKYQVFFRKNRENADGYGQSTEVLINALESAGISVSHEYQNQEIGIVYSYPHPLQSLKTKKKVLYSMFESTKIDPKWVEYLEMADKVYVPSNFCKEAFASRGIESEVIPLGYNSDNFYYKEKEDDGIFTFTMYNAFDMRKGWDIAFKAFTEEFGDDMTVRLILKTTKDKAPIPILKSEYPNIEVVNKVYELDELRELLYGTDCFVFPSRGEGFGLTPLEALACGTTSIIPNAHGISEYFDDRYFIGLSVEGTRLPVYKGFDLSVVGEMVEPSVEDLKKKMRWAYENREKCWEMGRKGSSWVRDNYTIKRTGVLLANKLRELGLVSDVVDMEVSNPKSKGSVAFFLQNRGLYSGGRIFCYQILHALCEIGYDVTIYTNMKPPFEDDMSWNKGYKTVIHHNIEDLKVEADIYMGAVKEGNVACARNVNRTGRKGYCFIFDPVPMVERYEGERVEHERGWYFEVDALVKNNPRINVVLLTEIAKEVCDDYYKKNQKFVLQPCVNDLIADKFVIRDREDIIVASATTGERDKGFEKSLKAFSLLPKNWKYHVFTSKENSKLPELIRKYDLKGRVIPHYNKDDYDKYEVYSRAKVMLCASPYEGYGMWLAEGRYMGLNCVVVWNDVFEEVVGKDNHVYMANREEELDLVVKLSEAVKRCDFEKSKKDYSFNCLVSKLEEILSE